MRAFRLPLSLVVAARVVAPFAVGLYIASAYWFTASTSFANPAVTLARSLSDSFAGIAPESVAGFVSAELVGGALALTLFRWLLDSPRLAMGAARHVNHVPGMDP